jgi:putative transposase
MEIEPGHRKRIKHWHEPGHAHELTFSCYQRLPLLESDNWKRLLSQSIDRAIEKYSFDLVAFVYMPEHVHLIVLPRSDEAPIDRLLWAIKRPFSYRVKQDLTRQHSPWLHRLTVRERPGRLSFRFWQEGPGYDRNLMSYDAMVAAMDYIHLNPVRRELCEHPDQWKWSSWKHYHEPDQPADPDLPTVHGIEF